MNAEVIANRVVHRIDGLGDKLDYYYIIYKQSLSYKPDYIICYMICYSPTTKKRTRGRLDNRRKSFYILMT